ncbi:lysozyme inhibitor LprI family protein [Metapseudomonas resinovorans]|uniref:Lysozyme inhibitor LprI-like N-terminal domain-containing protein n=1 Tax=Metapseudomonas resinovorans NBRC 106553 TaxID=1245471 RepID=S6AF25_METRE|nr:lysozyme inhibitor LprI family protein [Pseudomonas resinovorans]BAN46255.1 hypothetical protein PCA10_05230 [Pseudomonas resinovorans NBRC 106553]
MQTIKPFLLATALCSLSLGANAADEAYSATYGSCMDASQGVTAKMLDCIAAETKLQDARLNREYQAAMQAQKAWQPQLRAVQRHWIKYRDADCAFVGSLTGGSIDSLNRASCYLEKTAQRADELARLGPQDR